MSETRRDQRVARPMKVRFKSASLDQFVEQYSYDISRGGLFIKAKQPMPVGELLKFELQLADQTSVLSGIGRVVWRREPEHAGPDKPAGMGLKFVKMDPTSRDLVERIVTSRDYAPGNFESEPEGAESSRVTAMPSTVPTSVPKPIDESQKDFFFPESSPTAMPAMEDRTSIRHASEFLAAALAGGEAETEARAGATIARKRTAEIEAERAAADAKVAERERAAVLGAAAATRSSAPAPEPVAAAAPAPEAVAAPDAVAAPAPAPVSMPPVSATPAAAPAAAPSGSSGAKWVVAFVAVAAVVVIAYFAINRPRRADESSSVPAPELAPAASAPVEPAPESAPVVAEPAPAPAPAAPVVVEPTPAPAPGVAAPVVAPAPTPAVVAPAPTPAPATTTRPAVNPSPTAAPAPTTTRPAPAPTTTRPAPAPTTTRPATATSPAPAPARETAPASAPAPTPARETAPAPAPARETAPAPAPAPAPAEDPFSY